jgi:tRNA-splicing ligase RtcB
MIDGRTLIGWGLKPGPWFKEALAAARDMEERGTPEDSIKEAVLALRPAAPAVLRRRIRGDWSEAIHAETDEEKANLESVRAHMAELMRCPVVEFGSVMPDACPASQALGTIPVGGAVASRGIHPAFHSSDICCSMWVSLFAPTVETGVFLDAVQASTRFGPGGRRPEDQVPDPITDEIEETRNPFLAGLAGRAKAQLADQGDGNHFAYLGEMVASDDLYSALAQYGHAYQLTEAVRRRDRHERLLALVTHHGSRDLGAQVYKRGQEAAVRHTRRVSPETPPHQAWLDPDGDEGQAYLDALAYVERWTRRNHQLVHERTAARLGIAPLTAFGNAHNFVWRRGGLFHHGKGATPAWRDESGDPFSTGAPLLGVIPLNMAEPVLVTLGKDNAAFGSWSPHGAGRNKSRTALLKELGLHGLPPTDYLARSRELLAEQTAGLDVRFFFDRPDVSETPVAYKDAAAVREQIDRFGLAEVVAEITPLGCLMAGDYDKPWLRPPRRDVQDDVTGAAA